MVTLQSSEVKEISEDEYEAGLKAQSPAPKWCWGRPFSTDSVCGRCIKAASVHGISL